MIKKNLGNVIKGWFTSIMGGVVMILTTVLLFTKDIAFVWEGLAGLGAGVIILMMPETIEKFIMAGIKAFGGKADTGYNDLNKPF